MSERRAVIIANGQLADLQAARDLIHTDDFLVAANGGTYHLLSMGLNPEIVIGDLDSLEEHIRIELKEDGVQFLPYPGEKDETDLELALQYAYDQGFQRILIVAGLGGRLDQTLGNLTLLSRSVLTGLDIRMDDGIEESFFITSSAEIHGSPGDIVSLIPWGNHVEGIVTFGLRYPLNNETLYPDRTRGLSNVLLAEVATIRIRSGRLLCIHRRE